MFKFKQEQINNDPAVQSLVLNTKGKLNPRLKDLIENFDDLTDPSSLLQDKKSNGCDSWGLPELKQGPKNKLTLETHFSIFGKSPSWNYLTLARDIAELNNLAKLPSKKSVQACLAKQDVKLKDIATAEREVQLERDCYVKDYPVEFVLDVLFGNPDIQWKEAAALVKGIDLTADSKIYKGYSHKGLESKVSETFIKQPYMVMNGGKHFDRFELFNALMRAENKPITEVPSGFRLKDFEAAPLEWISSDSVTTIYSRYYSGYVKGIGESPYFKSDTPNSVVAFLSQVTESHVDNGPFYFPPTDLKPRFDQEDAAIIERIKAARVPDSFLFNGKKDPLAYFLYTFKKHQKCWDWKAILGYKV